MAQPLHIGLIGPGIMGTPMGHNLINAGYALSVYSRRPESSSSLMEAGADYCQTPSDLAANVDVVICIVSDTPDVEEVLLGSQGVIEGARENQLVIDMSTISPVATRNIAKQLNAKGVHMLDAPVSGGDIGAKAGTLTIMVGGSKEDFEFALPMLEVMGKTITHIGAQGAGQTCKACNQLIIAQSIVAITEAFDLAEAGGVDPAKVREALLGGFAYSKALEIHGQRIIDDEFTPGFKAALHLKDMNIVSSTAEALGLTLEGTKRSHLYMQELVDQGFTDVDSAALSKVASTYNKTSPS